MGDQFYENEETGSNLEKPIWDDLEAEMAEEDDEIVKKSRKNRRKMERERKRKKNKEKIKEEEMDLNLDEIEQNNPSLKSDIDEINKLEVEATGEHFFKY